MLPLNTGIRDGQLIAHRSFWQLTQTRNRPRLRRAVHLTAYEDVLVLAKPHSA